MEARRRRVMGIAVAAAIVWVGASSTAGDARPRRRPARPVTVMALGDSITDGYNVPGGYRVRLQALLKKTAKVDFVGSSRNGPVELVDQDHEGHSGFRIDEIAAGVPAWVGTTRPRVVLLMIGTNDLNQLADLPAAADRLYALLGAIRAASPGVRIVVSKIPPLPDRRAEREAFNDQLPVVAARARKAGLRVTLVDAPSRMLDSDLADGVHPTGHGYDLIADGFYPAARAAISAAARR